MKKLLTVSLTVAVFALMSTLFFTSCENEEDTVVQEPTGAFASAVIGLNNKSLTPGVNGYMAEPFDTAYTDATATHYISGVRYYQSSSGYYVSSKEELSLELVNLWDTLGLNKDSLFHAFLAQGSLPWYTPASGADSTFMTGMRIRWRSADGDWWSTDEGSQAGSITVDTTQNTTVFGGVSTHTVYLQFDCTLYQANGSGTMTVTGGKGRFSLMNTMFY